MAIEIRPARPGDGAVVHGMSLELARSHGYEADFTSQPEDLERALFQPGAIVGALVAEVDGEPAGMAFWHRSFTTFRGKEVMYLEDLSVLPRFQRRGVGRALLKAVARLAIEKGFPSIAWLVMSWNDGAKSLYETSGAEIEEGLCFCRLRGEALERMAQ